ncbi:unnamed protein product [Miscanthus lutarioriparius]|uniref:NIF system FeS cluster assembly NifU C-terminal domain-containing protein n=1 Tax=Miscanthus lutarioriparius TaxID=422564 RepID=A0A811RKA3_9POAL|nr:unnamed protein product [Miscanthus lutarioriparius]
MATSAAAAVVVSAWAPAASSSSSSSSMVWARLPLCFCSLCTFGVDWECDDANWARCSGVEYLPCPFTRSTEPIAVLCYVCEAVARAVAGQNTVVQLPLTTGNVESGRPYLIADGGDVALHEINGNVVRLKLQGARGSCPSSVTTMKMSIQRRLMENIPEISAVERVADKEMGLKLNEANVQKVLAEIRPYLAGKGGGELEFTKIVGHTVKVWLTGRAAGVKTVQVALTQKLREKIPSIAAIRVYCHNFCGYLYVSS